MAAKKAGADASLPELRQRITDLVARNAVAMVQRAIDGVMEEGQYQAIKYLFEMVGIYPVVTGDTDEPQDGLSEVLLQHLGVSLSEEKRSSTKRGPEIHPVE